MRRRDLLVSGGAALLAGCVTRRGGGDFAVRARAGEDARPAILAAIGAAHDAGGGRVVLAPGLWRVDGPIGLRSNVELHLEQGAVVRFSPDPRFYLPPVFTRWEGTEVWSYSPLLYTRGQRNVAITGPGVFEGQGREHFLPWRDRQKPDQNRLRQMGADGAPVRDRVFGAGHWLRPAFCQFIECRDVLIDGPTFRDSPFWVIHPVYCDRLVVRNVTVVSGHINSDGCDPDSCTNVLIERCRFDVNDDCVAIKSGRDQDGWRVARPSRNILVRDCEMRTTIASAFAIGSEMSGGARDITVERLVVPQAEHALYFKANLDRGGVIENVRVRDVAVEQTKTLIHFTTAYHSYRGGAFPPTYRNFAVSNVRCANAERALHIVGVETAPVEDVRLSAITVARASEPNLIAHVRGLKLDQVTVNGRAESLSWTDVGEPTRTGSRQYLRTDRTG
jgi:polygalacturonase